MSDFWSRAAIRLLLVIGAAMVVAGWGLTRYAAEQQRAASSDSYRIQLWVRGKWNPDQDHMRPGAEIYRYGICAMSLGTALVVGALPIPIIDPRPSEVETDHDQLR